MIKTIYEDKDILVVYKPIGLLSHRAVKSNLGDLLTELKQPNYHVITRLDANTEGLVLLAKNAVAASILSKLGQTSGIAKKYRAIVVGYIDKLEDVITAYLLKDSENSVVRLSSTPTLDASEIKTKYTVLKEHKGFSLLEVELITGKTHQIRAHLAHIGHPVLGDPLYGNKKMNQMMHEKTQLLLSYRIVFDIVDETNPFYYLNQENILVQNDKITNYFK
ncbi:MAG: RluA family pseudouridine synthase [Candidatus Izemoplasmatales bacterium]